MSLFLFHGLRIWPGVLIGIAAVHLLPVGGRDPWTFRLGFILGETLQYFAGYFMVRRVIGPPPVYDEEKSFLKFALLAPLMGLVNPSVQWGINLFFGAGRNFLWLYSWMGECFGILIFTPIVCLWHREGLKNWRGRSLVATLPVAGSFIIALGFFVYANNIENARFRQDFIQATKSLAENIEGRLNELEDHLSFVERFYAGSDFVSRDEFRVFLSAFLLDHPEVMIQWAPRIEQKERAKFETDARKRGGPVFNISERATDLGLVREGERQVYFPVEYSEPSSRFTSWAGFDWASHSGARTLMGQVTTSDRTKGTILPLVDNTRTVQDHVVIMNPVYTKTALNLPDKNKLEGILLVAISLKDLLSDLWKKGTAMGISFDLREHGDDESAKPGPGLLPQKDMIFDFNQRFDLLGQPWDLHSEQSRNFVRSHKSWTVPGIFIGGLFFTAMLGAFSLGTTGRTLRIAGEVEERTKELRKANAELSHFISEKEGVERMKTDFISSVSHELRTPLTSIKGYLQIVLHDGDMPETVRREFLGIVDEEADRLNYLVEDLLEISRLESSAVKITVGSIDINELVRTIIKSLRPIADKKKLRLEVDTPANLGTVEAHPGKIRSLITNLLSNALKFTVEENGLVALRIRGDETDVHIEVSDSGIGIPKEDLSKIFERFYRVERQGIQIQGTGLGLAIAKRIVDLHHGDISAQSELGKGTTFTVRLPRHYVAETEGGSTFDSTNI